MIQHLTEIVEEARKRGKKRLAVAYGQDSHTLEAVYEAYKEGLVEPTLFGDKEVVFYDERFTSVMAHRTMLESGIGRMARRDKALVDKISATIILQSYMEFNK